MIQASCLIDVTRCTGCRSCQVACKQWNQLPAEDTTFGGDYENPNWFSHVTWMRVVFCEHRQHGGVVWRMSRQGCMHCLKAPCLQACPADAIYRTTFGAVAIDPAKCVGCRFCSDVCPFRVIGFDQDLFQSRKCDFCASRLKANRAPACAVTCPSGVIHFGERPELIAMAQNRVQQLQAAGTSAARIYGLSECGGLAMLYVLAAPPEDYGLPATFSDERLSNDILIRRGF